MKRQTKWGNQKKIATNVRRGKRKHSKKEFRKMEANSPPDTEFKTQIIKMHKEVRLQHKNRGRNNKKSEMKITINGMNENYTRRSQQQIR